MRAFLFTGTWEVDFNRITATNSRQVCVEPRTSALNMTLPAAAARAPEELDVKNVQIKIKKR